MNAAADMMQVRQETLDNGLSIYLSENHEQPRISARIVVRAGAAEDPSDRTGIAHYLEHMLANKGTQRLGTTDYAAEAPLLDGIRRLYDELAQAVGPEQARAIYAQIDALGMKASQYAVPNELKQVYGMLGARKLNAFTSHDQTAYVVDIPSNRLAHWACLEGDRFRHPVFRAFQTEVETVFEEKNRSLDDPNRRVSAALRRQLWGAHPYSREILGEREHLRRPSISQMEAFFSTWYVPNNMAVVLAGDFDSEAALALIREHFGALKPRALPPRARSPLPDASDPGAAVVLAPGVEEVRLAWRTVPYTHPARHAAALADMLLDNRATGLLNRNLIVPQQVRAAGTYTQFLRDAGAQIIWGRPLEGQSLDEVEGRLLEQVSLLQAGDFSEEDLSAILLDYEQTYQKGLEENGTRAGLMMRAFLHDLPWRGAFSELEGLRAVQPEQIVAFANDWLNGSRVSVRRLSGEPERLPPLTPPISGRSMSSAEHSAFFGQILQIPSQPIPLNPAQEGVDYHRRAPKSGLVLYSAPNPFNGLSRLTIRAPRGRAGDPAWSVAASLWQRAGTPALDLLALRQALYRMGVGLSLSTGQRLSALSVSGPDEQLAAGLALLRERICTPRIEASEAQRLLSDAIAQRHQYREERQVLDRALQEWLLHDHDSAFLGGALSDSALRAFDVEAELGRLQALWSDPWEVLYAGPRGPDAVLPLLERAPSIPPMGALPTTDYHVRARSGVWLVHHPSVQASVTVLCPWGHYAPDSAHLHQIYGEYMGGNAGLVFQEIREARGMAYAAHAGWRLGWQAGDANLLWASVGTQADKAAEATRILVDMLRSLPLQPARFERARASAIERLQTSWIRFRDLPRAAADWHRRGQLHDPRPERLQTLQGLTPHDLTVFAASFAAAPIQVAIVGDLNRIDQTMLSDIAPVTQVPAENLFTS